MLLCGILAFFLAGCVDLEDAAPAPEAAAPSFERSMLDGFEAEVAEARTHYRVPGAVVTVVYGDHLVFSAGFGSRAASGGQPLSEDSLFRLGSLTRPISTSLLATLVDERRLDWRGGLPGGLSPALVEALRRQDARFEAQGVEPVAATDSAPPDGLAGLLARTSCCGVPRFSVDAFGLVVRRALEDAGEGEGGEAGYRRALQERLIGPAGMVRTAVVDRLPALVEDFATPHALTLGGEIEAIDYPASSDVASTGVVSTAADLGRLLSVHIEHGISQRGKRVVSGNNLAASRRPMLAVEAPDGSAPLAESCCRHGGGWSIADLGEGAQWIGAEGGIDGYAGLLGFLPARRLGLVVLSNLDAEHGGRDFAREVRDAFLARLLGSAGTVAHRLDHERTLKTLQRLEKGLGAADLVALRPYFGDYEGGWSLVREGGEAVLRRELESYRLRAATGADGTVHVLVDGAALGMRVALGQEEDGRRRLLFQGLDGVASMLSAVEP